MFIQFPEYLQELPDESAIDTLDLDTIQELFASAIRKSLPFYMKSFDASISSGLGADTVTGRKKLLERLELDLDCDMQKYFHMAYLFGTQDIAQEVLQQNQISHDDLLNHILFGVKNAERQRNKPVNDAIVELFIQFALDPTNQEQSIIVISNIANGFIRHRNGGFRKGTAQILQGFEPILKAWHERDPSIKIPFQRSTRCGGHDIETKISLFEVSYLFNLSDDLCVAMISDDPAVQKEQLLVTLGSSVGSGGRLNFTAHQNKLPVQRALIDRIAQHEDASAFLTHALRWYVKWTNDGGQIPTPDCHKTIAMLIAAGADVNSTGPTFETDIIDLKENDKTESTFGMTTWFHEKFNDSWKIMLPHADLSAAILGGPLHEVMISKLHPSRLKNIRKDLISELQRVRVLTDEKSLKKTNDILTVLIDSGISLSNISEELNNMDGVSETDIFQTKASMVEKIFNDEQKERQPYFRYALWSLLLAPVGVGLIMSAVFTIIYLVKKHSTATIKANDMSWQSFEKIQPKLSDQNNKLVVVNSVEPKKKPTDAMLLDKFNFHSKLTDAAKLDNDVRVYSFS